MAAGEDEEKIGDDVEEVRTWGETTRRGRKAGWQVGGANACDGVFRVGR
jgi:hypothetical protein